MNGEAGGEEPACLPLHYRAVGASSMTSCTSAGDANPCSVLASMIYTAFWNAWPTDIKHQTIAKKLKVSYPNTHKSRATHILNAVNFTITAAISSKWASFSNRYVYSFKLTSILTSFILSDQLIHHNRTIRTDWVDDTLEIVQYYCQY